MTTPQEELTTVHQALHGYADGHRLLASSSDVGREASGLMLVLSDMSGPTMIPGFESYLTGYALSEDLYVVARTWYAPEMPRPGCVWTHSLLFSSIDLGRVQDLRTLPNVFRRPHENSDSDYRQPLHLSLSTRTTSPSFVRREEAAQLISTVYGEDERPVFVLSDNSDLYEALVLSLWAQQWPALKQTFSFCTGSLALRKLHDDPLDVQVIPASRSARFERNSPDGMFLDLKDMDEVDSPRWASEAAADVVDRGTDIRGFMWEHAHGIETRRGAFQRLASAYVRWMDVLGGQASAASLVEELGTSFPAVSEATELKRVLLDRSPHVPEETLLEGLVRTQHAAAFDAEELGIKDRAKALWATNRQSIETLILLLAGKRKISPVADALLSGAAEAIGPRDAIRLAARRPVVMPALVSRNLSLAKSPAIWADGGSGQKLVLSTLARGRLSRRDRRSIVGAMVRSGNAELPANLISSLGGEAITWVLEWLNSPGTFEELPQHWTKALQDNTSELVTWFERASKLEPSVAVTLAKLLDPLSPTVRHRGTEPWLKALKRHRADRELPTWSEVLVFSLALGFSNPDDGSPALVASVFQPVHDAAEAGLLSQRAWKKLEQFFPQRTWWKRDDRPFRLRRALVDKFVQFQWPFEEFVRCFESAETLRETLDSSRWNARAYLLRGLTSFEGSDYGISPSLAAEVNKWAKW